MPQVWQSFRRNNTYSIAAIENVHRIPPEHYAAPRTE